jgi:hypothetical protein
MLSIFSLKKSVRNLLLTAGIAVVSAPCAMADGTFDLGGLDAQAQTIQESQAVDAGPQAARPAMNGVMAGRGMTTQPVARQNYVPNLGNRTGNQRLGGISTATRTILSQNGSQSLPVCNLDSFVAQSGYSDQIYGDEGDTGIPPFMGMDESHTIGSGIQSGGLTTNHAINYPSAWCDYN